MQRQGLTLRLYPPAWVLLRRASEPVEIDGTRVAAGDVIWLSQWVMQRMPEYFSDPEAFMPERFDPQHGMKHPQFAYFPFGGRPRLCLGMMFASMEARIVLATLLQRYTPVLADASPVLPRPLITLRPKGRIRMRIEEAGLPVAIKGYSLLGTRYQKHDRISLRRSGRCREVTREGRSLPRLAFGCMTLVLCCFSGKADEPQTNSVHSGE